MLIMPKHLLTCTVAFQSAVVRPLPIRSNARRTDDKEFQSAVTRPVLIRLKRKSGVVAKSFNPLSRGQC